MKAKVSYLLRSKTGWFSYRRKVPERLRPYFPRTETGSVMIEWKTSFRTKDALTAQRLWAAENRKFAEAERIAEAIHNSQQGNVKATDALKIAKHIAIEAGFHPDQAPRLPDNPTEQDWQNYKVERKEWDEWLVLQREILIEQDADERIDEEQRESDYREGRWGPPGYETPYKPAKPNSILALATKILEGELRPTIEPTWLDAVDLYISVNKQEKTRNQVKEQKWEAKTRGLLDRFSADHGGRSLRLDGLDRANIRIWLQEAYENQSTRNRYVNTLSAVINTWNRENPSQAVANPFSGLANKQKEYESAQKRLSFKPHQFHAFLEAIEGHKNEEVRLIGLLMAWTGCRTSEAAGLSVRDIKLDADVPHVVFRSNQIRRMGKGGLERAVPVVRRLLTELVRYKPRTDKDSAYFQKYGTTKGFDSVSAALRYLLTKKADVVDERLVPYSLRHTLKDRLAAAGVDTSLAEYILGHVSKGSSRIHKQYGTLTPPRHLLDALEKAESVETWGYFEDG